jgi:hypothetical protein
MHYIFVIYTFAKSLNTKVYYLFLTKFEHYIYSLKNLNTKEH